MLSDDDSVRQRDPSMRRRAVGWGFVVAAVIAAVAVGTSLAGRPRVVATTSPTLTPPATTAPTPVPAQPLVGSRFSAVEDPVRHQLMVFGGLDGNDTTWLWDGRHWTLARPRASPPGRSAAAAAYNPVTRTVMMFGGRLASGQLLHDTWGWDGADWRQLDPGTAGPPSAQRSVMAWDAAGDRMLLVDNPDGAPGQIWLWNGARWTHDAAGDPPASASVIAMAQDPLTRSLLAISCCLVAQGTTSTLAWSGAGWVPVVTAMQPLFGVSLTVDPATTRLVLFTDAALVSGGETWSWDGRGWTSRAGPPLPAFPEAVVTDADAGTMVLLGSPVEPVLGNPQPLHVWSWTGSAWSLRG